MDSKLQQCVTPTRTTIHAYDPENTLIPAAVPLSNSLVVELSFINHSYGLLIDPAFLLRSIWSHEAPNFSNGGTLTHSLEHQNCQKYVLVTPWIICLSLLRADIGASLPEPGG